MTGPTLNRASLQRLADLRAAEARLLLDNGHYPGAYYLAGYAVECALKACIAKGTRQFDFPDLDRVRDSYSHDFRRLAATAGLNGDFRRECDSNPTFQDNWETVKKWHPDSRYHHSISRLEAEELIDAITGDNGGILPWIKVRW